MGSQLKYISLDQIRANPVALRDVNRKAESFQELVDSVKSQGIILPISVREKAGEDGKQYELIDGLQRFTAATEAGTGVVGEMGEDGKGVIPAQVLDRSDADALMTQIIGNAHKVETRPVDYAKAIMRILGYNPTWTESELAAKLSKSPTWISKNLGLVKLTEAIQPLVNEGKIPVANAYVLAKLPAEEQGAWVQRAMELGANEFGPAVLARAKEIKDANRKGAEAPAESFVAVSHLRKKTEIDAAIQAPATIAELINAAGISDPVDAAIYALKWAVNLDQASVKAQEEKYNARKQQEADERARRAAEREKKKQEQAAAKSAEAAATQAAVQSA